ncbi:hypothetical protein [Ralstonia pseudosolanacearum]|uniref:hypothetical protein n=1 Tax=Ralstonia pseudosolanacearum TaxID=1310165 RepID=UPI003CEDC4AA
MKIFIFALIMALMVTMISAASFEQSFADPAQYSSFAGGNPSGAFPVPFGPAK